MSAPYQDTFSGSGSLGTIEVGGVAWSALTGTWARSGGKAVTTAAASTNPLAVVDVGWGDVDASISVSPTGGDALYFRVVDASNWLRLRLRSTVTTSSYQSGWDTSAWTTTGATCNLGGPQFTSICSGTDPASGLCTSQTVYGGAGECSVGTNPNGTPATFQTRTVSPHYVTTSSTSYSLVLEKCVAGTVTQLGSVAMGSTQVTSLRVTANGSTITAYANAVQKGVFTDATFATATKHGIGRGGPTSSDSSAIDDFALTALNRAPNAPALNGPVGGVSIDSSVTQRFSWTFSDPDPGDSQSKANLYYRVVGASSWTTVAIVGPSTFYDMPAATLTAGDDYEWQVETYDAVGNLGARSASSFFSAASPPTGPTWTSPTNNATVNQTQVFDWSVTAQDSYQVRRVADSAGTPDTGTVYFDTGEVVDAAARTIALTFGTNGRTEHVQIRVKVSGLWSDWTDSIHPVSYTPPAVPLLTVAAVAAPGETVLSGFEVDITQPTPTGSEPAVISADIFRREIDGAGNEIAGSNIRVATALAANATWTDWTFVSDSIYQYQAVGVAANGTSTPSAWSPGPGAGLGSGGIYDTSTYDTATYG